MTALKLALINEATGELVHTDLPLDILQATALLDNPELLKPVAVLEESVAAKVDQFRPDLEWLPAEARFSRNGDCFSLAGTAEAIRQAEIASRETSLVVPEGLVTSGVSLSPR